MVYQIVNVTHEITQETHDSIDSVSETDTDSGTTISFGDDYEYFYNLYDIHLYEEEIFEEIADYEDSLPYTECNDNQYCIGSYTNIDNQLILSIRIQLSTFYKYTQEYLIPYMFYSSEIPINITLSSARTQIMQIKILEDDTFTVILKTHWIRIIQRTWKRIFKQRKLYVLCLKKLSMNSSIRQKIENKQYPGLRGMLVEYNSDYGKDATEIINFT
jgi:hypothetical protein